MTGTSCWAVASSKETNSQIKARGGLEAHPTRNFPEENSLFVEQASCLFPEAHKKLPRRKFTLCGTGILPVPRSPQNTSQKKIHSLWNRHLACSTRPTKHFPEENSLFVEQASCLFHKATYISFHRGTFT